MYATEELTFRELAERANLPKYGRRRGDYECPFCKAKIWSSRTKSWDVTCNHDKSEIWQELLKRAGLWVDKKSERNQTNQSTTPGSYLSFELKAELAASAIPDGPWQGLNFSSITSKKAIAEFLGWKGYYGPSGWISTMGNGSRTQNQFKPEKPIHFLETKKAIQCAGLLLAGLPYWREFILDKGNKYLSSKAGYGPLIPKIPGDGARTYWEDFKADKSRTLRHTEGAKKAISSQVHGIDTVAYCGVAMWHGPEEKELFPEVAKMAEGRINEICFDADFARKSAVRRQIVDLATAIEKIGGRPIVRVWDESIGKGIDDVIAAGHNFEEISETLTLAEFKLKYPDPDNPFFEPDPDEYIEYQHHLEFLDFCDLQDLKRKRELWGENKRISSYKKWKRSLVFTSHYTQTQGKYVDAGWFSPEIGAFVALKGDQGDGKTEAVKRILAYHLFQGRTVAVIGSRNSTLVQTARRLGIKHLIVDGDFESLVEMKSRGWAHCIDSIMRWKDAEELPQVLLLDEFSSLLTHAFLGSTIRDRRVEILEFFGQILRQMDFCYVLDAGLKDGDIEKLEAWSGKAFVKISKTPAPDKQPYRIYNYIGADRKADFPAASYEHNSYQPKDKKYSPNSIEIWRRQFQIESAKHPVAVFSDSLKEIKRLIILFFGEDKLDFYTALENGILRVDSETRNYPEVHKFLEDPPGFILKHRIKVLLCSPSVDSGVSLAFDREELEMLGLTVSDELDYFGAVFLFNSHLANEPIWQMAGRVRDRRCPRHIFVKTFSPTSKNEQYSEFERQWIEYLREIIDDYLATCENQNQYQIAPSILGSFGDIAAKKAQLFLAHTSGDMLLFGQISRDILARQRYEKENLRSTLIERFVTEGAIVRDVVGNPDFAPTKKKEKVNETIAYHRAGEIFGAEEIDEMTASKAEALYKEYLATPEERLAAEKFLFCNQLLPGIEQTDFWGIDFLADFKFLQPQSYGQLYRRLHLQNFNLFNELESLNVLQKVELEIKTLATDVNQTLQVVKTWFKTGIDKLVSKAVIKKQDIEETVKKASNKNYTKYLGKRGKQSAVQWLNEKVLKPVGLQVKQAIRKGDCDDFILEDKLASNEWYLPVLELMHRKFEARLIKAREKVENMATFINNQKAKKVNLANNNPQSHTERDLQHSPPQLEKGTLNPTGGPEPNPLISKDAIASNQNWRFSPPKSNLTPNNPEEKIEFREGTEPTTKPKVEATPREELESWQIEQLLAHGIAI